MTGSAADADDLVQEAFVRALQRRPAGGPTGWRPWLAKVAANLAIDALRGASAATTLARGSRL